MGRFMESETDGSSLTPALSHPMGEGRGEGGPSGAWGGWRRFVVAAVLGSVGLLEECEHWPALLGF